jgi:2,3-dimethylmalate lyase
MSSAASLRELIAQERLLIAPGAPNALTAVLIEEAGFPVVYVSGAGVSNTQLGVADVGLVSLRELVDQVRYVTAAVEAPVIADADTGFGNAINVIRTVKELERAGAAGLHLEDQVTPKRCGHFEGKQIVSKTEMANKVRAAVEARRDDDFVIIARTDARAVTGLEDAIERALAYREAGADMIFVEAPRTAEELETVAQQVPGPLVANMVEDGKTPLQSAEALEKMGYRLVLYANLAMRAAVLAMQQVLSHLAEHGDSMGVRDRIITMEERNRITDLAHYQKMEERYLSEV